LNANCFAGYLNLGLLSGAGLLAVGRPILPRWLVAVGIGMLGALVALSGSRAGIAALALALLAFCVCLRSVRRAGAELSRVELLVGSGVGTVLIAMLLVFLGGSKASWNQATDFNLEKVDLIKGTWPLIRDHFFFGVGRGAFEGVFQAYKLGPWEEVYAHPENVLAQWASEWGVPLSAGLVAITLIALSPARLRANRSATAAGAWCGLLALLVQNLADLSLELPAVALAAVCTYGALWGAAQSDRNRGGEVSVERGRLKVTAALPLGFAVLAPCLIVAVLVWGIPANADEKQTLAQAYRGLESNDAAKVAGFRGSLRRAMLRHPGEPFFSRLGAALALKVGDQNPMPWLTRALERGGTSARTHYLLARTLARMSADDQALLELRFAAANNIGMHRQIARATLHLTRDFERIKRAVPPGQAGARLLASIADVVGKKDWGLRIACLREGLRRDPSAESLEFALATTLVSAIEQGMAPCDAEGGKACGAEAEGIAKALAARNGADARPAMILAQLELVLGRPDAALARLAGACARAPDPVDCFRLQVVAAIKTGATDRIDASVRALSSAACDGPKSCSDALAWAAAEAESHKLWRPAAQYYQRAVQEHATDSLRLRLARAATAAGDDARAVVVLAGLVRKNPGDAKLRAELEAGRKRLLAETAGQEQKN
jgi:hypothetical protein